MAVAASSNAAQLRFLTDAAHLLRQAAPETSAYLITQRSDLASQPQYQQQQAGSSSSSSLMKLTDVQRQHICTCCGHILIPGSDGTTLMIQAGRPSLHDKKRAKRKKGKTEWIQNNTDSKLDDEEKTARITIAEPARTTLISKPHSGIRKIFTCGLCGRDTAVALPPPPPLPKHRKRKTAADNKTALGSKAASASVSASSTLNAVTTTTTSTGTNTTATITAAMAATEKVTTKLSSNANSKKRAKNRKAGLLALLDKSRGSDSGGRGGFNLSFDDFRKR